MPFNPDTVSDVLAKINRLRELRRRQGELLEELEAALIQECGKHLGHPVARRVFIEKKQAQLKVLGFRVTPQGQLKNMKGKGDDAEAHYIACELKPALRLESENDQVVRGIREILSQDLDTESLAGMLGVHLAACIRGQLIDNKPETLTRVLEEAMT